MARPTKLTPERHEGIVRMVRAGSYCEQAARANGVSPAAYYEWMKRGRDAGRDPETGQPTDAADAPFVEFMEAVKEAEAAAEIESIALIRRAANGGTWQAAAWYLERKYADRWGRRDHLKQEVSGPEGGPLQIDARAELAGLLQGLREDEAEEPDESEPEGSSE